MNFTNAAPTVPLKNFKRTKIIATVGPATNSYEAILSLIAVGANGLRLNFSHGNHEERTQQIKWIRRASFELKKPVAIIQDLQGPKIRLGDFDGKIELTRGQAVRFGLQADYAASGIIPTQYDLSTKVKAGEQIYLFDGKVKALVDKIEDGLVHATVQNDGFILKRKGMNLPDTDFGGDILTAKDRADLIYGSTQDLDYVALSFVQTADDINNLRVILNGMNSTARIISKIETRAAVENLEAIVKASDAVMIARGDLAVETPAESVPIVQRQIIGLGQRYARPTIVATQMLASMVDSPEPTRAEVSDIATAVLVGADCVMLSDETANGNYPVETVQTMKRVILYTESHIPVSVKIPEYEDHSKPASISRAVLSLAENVEAKAIVAETKSGATAYQLASRRTQIPVIAVTSDQRTCDQLALAYGVKSYLRPVDAQAASKLTNWLHKNKVLNRGDMVVTCSGQYPGVVGMTDTIKVRVIE